MRIESLVAGARNGDLAAYAELVAATQDMVLAVCYRVLRDESESGDAAQETFLRAFTHLNELREDAAFAGWLRRIAVTTARSMARKRRALASFSDEVPDVPILDDVEQTWTDRQRQSLAQALVMLAAEDRRICERFYHGRWNTARLARDAGVNEAAMRKRLQRIREQLREVVEMHEREQIKGKPWRENLPAVVVELLGRPRLTDMPENPVGRMVEKLRARFADYRMVDVPEVIAVADAEAAIGSGLATDFLTAGEVHFLNAGEFLRYDATLPLLIAAKGAGVPARLATAAQVYRNQSPSPISDQAFHQFETLSIDRADILDARRFMGEVLEVVSDLLPGRGVRIDPVNYATCARAWEIAVEDGERWTVVASWGIYCERIVRYLGGDPAIDAAFGLGFGLERLAALHYDIDDIRKLQALSV